MQRTTNRIASLAFAAWCTGCYSGVDPARGAGLGGIDLDRDDGSDDGDADADALDAEGNAGARAQLRRLTGTQLTNTLAAMFGDGLVLPDALEPDLMVGLFSTIGAAQVVTSELGVEQYAAAFEDVVEQVFDDPVRKAAVVPCDPASAECRTQVLRTLMHAAFRRPLAEEEVFAYASLADANVQRLGDAERALQLAIQAVLASPSTLYLVELGEPDPDRPGAWRYTSVEMASRLAYFLWDGPPDEALLTAAEAGELVDPDEIREHATRMIDDPRARRGVLRFFDEYLGLAALAGVSKDPEIYPEATPELFAAMREESLRMIEHVLVDERGGWIDVLDASTTFVDPALAAVYGVTYPAGSTGFVAVQLPEARRGLLGTGAFLATQSHRTLTSPTNRGKWIQNRLRCVELAPPPPDVDSSIPDAPEGQPMTMRDRLEQHRTDPTCAGCHVAIDPLGLPLEHFDALGRFRTTDMGLAIDASGSLDGVEFDGLTGLAAALRDDPMVPACLTRQLVRYATGHLEIGDEDPWMQALVDELIDRDGRVLDFLPELVASPVFRRLAAPE